MGVAVGGKGVLVGGMGVAVAKTAGNEGPPVEQAVSTSKIKTEVNFNLNILPIIPDGAHRKSHKRNLSRRYNNLNI